MLPKSNKNILIKNKKRYGSRCIAFTVSYKMKNMKPNFLQNRAIACVLAIFCTLLWGTAFPFIKLGYAAFDVAEGDAGAMLLFAGLRFFLAGVMVLAFLCVTEKRFVPAGKTDIKAIAWLSVFQTFGQYLFTYIGIGFTTGANTSIITACASFLTVLGAAVFFKGDRLTAWKILGCALGFGGVLAMNGTGGFALDTLFGDLFILMSTVFAAAGNLIAKKITPGRSPVKITAYQLLFGGAALGIAGLICGGRLNFSAGNGLLILLWLAFVSAAAFTVWTALLKYHPASKISVFNLLVPVFGTTLSGLMLGENVFRLETLLSLGMISAGILFVNLSKAGEKHD